MLRESVCDVDEREKKNVFFVCFFCPFNIQGFIVIGSKTKPVTCMLKK